MRMIDEHPILEYRHGQRVKFSFDGREMEGYEGEPIAMALHANGVRIYRETPESLRKRAEAAELRRLTPLPQANVKGRPTKRDRRQLNRLRGGM